MTRNNRGRPLQAETGGSGCNRRVSDTTVRKESMGIRTASKWGRAQGLVQVNPADAENMPRPPEAFDAARSLADDEYSGVRSVSAPYLRAVITWAAETAMDKGTVRRLQLPNSETHVRDQGPARRSRPGAGEDDGTLEVAAEAMSGPERLTGRDRIAGIPATGARPGAVVPGDSAHVA